MDDMNKITVGLFNDSFMPMMDGVVMVVDNYAKRLSKFCNVVVFVPKYHKDFDDKIVDLCDYYNLREDDLLLNPSNIGYHNLFGLRIIDYGLTTSGQLLDF